jgi:hypothetical protein
MKKEDLKIVNKLKEDKMKITVSKAGNINFSGESLLKGFNLLLPKEVQKDVKVNYVDGNVDNPDMTMRVKCGDNILGDVDFYSMNRNSAEELKKDILEAVDRIVIEYNKLPAFEFDIP